MDKGLMNAPTTTCPRYRLRVIGECLSRPFGLIPAERIGRQIDRLRNQRDLTLVVRASALLGDSALDWLVENPGEMLLCANGQPLAVAVEAAREELALSAISGGSSSLNGHTIHDIGQRYIKKLRRRADLLVLDLEAVSVREAEWRLFCHVYKGVTDVVTKFVWPLPAYACCRIFSRVGITPNMVTFASLILTILAAWFFYTSAFVPGLACAWLMTFCDTVDGKLARATATSSVFGDILDHGIDYIHPPIWWLCLAWGLNASFPGWSYELAISAVIVLGSYVVGRAIEIQFKRRFAINPYTWRRFDSLFRAIVARRNIILLIFTAGLLAGFPVQAFVASAGWCIISIVIQFVRFHLASSTHTKEPVKTWMS